MKTTKTPGPLPWITVQDHGTSMPTPDASQVASGSLTREEAKRMAWVLYAADSPVVVELLLVAHNPAVSALKRYQAEMALEWFDPSVDLPRRPSDQEEPEPVRLLRLALLSGEMQVRIAAGDELARMLAPSSAWTTANGGR